MALKALMLRKKIDAKKKELEAKGKSLETTYQAAKENADKMRQLHDKLVGDIETLKIRQEAVKAKMAVAKTQEKVNSFSDGAEKAESAMAAFDRMEEKADAALDKANAIHELNSKPSDPAAAAVAKYAGVTDEAVDEELAALKKELGL